MSNEREEMETLVLEAADAWLGDGAKPGTTAEGYVVDALLAEGYHKPAVVTTAEELDALPVGSVVLDADGDVARRSRDPLGATCWLLVGQGFPIHAGWLGIPATVLHVGDAQ